MAEVGLTIAVPSQKVGASHRPSRAAGGEGLNVVSPHPDRLGGPALSTPEIAGLADALGLLAPRFDPGATGIDALQRLSGGASQETWAFDLVLSDGARQPLILRRVPPGERFGDRVIGPELEARVIKAAVAAGVPAPVIRYELNPSDGAGRGFIMDRIAGETLARRVLRDAAFASARARFGVQAGQILARIHGVDGDAIGLRIATPASEVANLRVLHAATGQHRPIFELALAWLAGNLPPAVPARLVHGDFRNGNLIFGPEGIRAVLDWEVAHLGDPMEDLAWLCVNSWRFGEIDKPVGGIADRASLYTAYEEASGRLVDPASIHFWEVLSTLRWGLTCAEMVGWIRRGEDASVERCMIARRASETEIDLLRLLLPPGERHAG